MPMVVIREVGVIKTIMPNKLFELFVEKDKPNKGDSLQGYSTLFLLQALAESKVNGMLVNNDKSARVFLLNGALYDKRGIITPVYAEDDLSFSQKLMGAHEYMNDPGIDVNPSDIVGELASRGFNGELKDDYYTDCGNEKVHILIEGDVITLEGKLAEAYISRGDYHSDDHSRIVFNEYCSDVYSRDNDVTTEELV